MPTISQLIKRTHIVTLVLPFFLVGCSMQEPKIISLKCEQAYRKGLSFEQQRFLHRIEGHKFGMYKTDQFFELFDQGSAKRLEQVVTLGNSNFHLRYEPESGNLKFGTDDGSLLIEFPLLQESLNLLQRYECGRVDADLSALKPEKDGFTLDIQYINLVLLDGKPLISTVSGNIVQK